MPSLIQARLEHPHSSSRRETRLQARLQELLYVQGQGKWKELFRVLMTKHLSQICLAGTTTAEGVTEGE